MFIKFMFLSFSGLVIFPMFGQLVSAYSVNITTHFRPPGTMRQVLFQPKDKVPKGKKMNVVYQAECDQCGEKYVGETQQPLSKRVH